MSALADVKLADSWAGEVAAVKRNDGLIHAAWTENTLGEQGYFLTNISMTSIATLEDYCDTKHMTPLKLSEGQYWGLDMAIRGDRIVLAVIIVISRDNKWCLARCNLQCCPAFRRS